LPPLGEYRHVRLSWDAVKNVPSQADSRPDRGAHDRMMSDIPEIIGQRKFHISASYQLVISCDPKNPSE